MLDSLKAVHREIARLAFEQFSPHEIAMTMGLGVERVRTILRDPLCQAAVSRMQDNADEAVVDVRRELARLNKPALEVLEDLLKNDGVPYNVQLSAAKDVLDRNGHAAVKQMNHLHVGLTRSELTEIKARAKDAGYVAEPEPDELDGNDCDGDDIIDIDPFQLEHQSCDEDYQNAEGL